MARRTWRIVALTLGLSMTLLGSGLLYLGVRESDQAATDLDQQLTTASAELVGAAVGVLRPRCGL